MLLFDKTESEKRPIRQYEATNEPQIFFTFLNIHYAILGLRQQQLYWSLITDISSVTNDPL